MFHFTLPDPGEGLVEAEIASWLVAPGDTVKVNDIIVEVETAKSLVELPSPVDGIVVELLAKVGEIVPVGSPIVVLDDARHDDKTSAMLVGSGPRPSQTARRPRARKKAAQPTESNSPSTISSLTPSSLAPQNPPEQVDQRAIVLAKPLVKKLARDLGVDLHQVKGSGPHGIIRREDVEAAATRPEREAGQDEEWRMPIRGIRRATAKNLVASTNEHVTVTEWLDVEVSQTVDLVASLKKRGTLGVRVSPLLLVAKACCHALAHHPDLNARWDGACEQIVYHRDVNLGIAADTPRGLMVPNIKNANSLNLRELAVALDSLIHIARQDQLQPVDYMHGTFTITNVGVFGVTSGTPVINGAESAILCIGAIQRRPWVVGESGSDHIEPRWVVTLSLSFDHRLIDGAQASAFLREVADLLHQPALMLVD